MLARWYRLRDFSKIEQNHNPNPYHLRDQSFMSFMTDSYVSVIPGFHLEIADIQDSYPPYQSKKSVFITCYFSPFYTEELTKMCEELGIDREIGEIRDGVPSWPPADPRRSAGIVKYLAMVLNDFNLKSLTSLLEYFNEYFKQRMQPQPFSPKLISDLNLIYQAVKMNSISNLKLQVPIKETEKIAYRRPEGNRLSDLVASRFIYPEIQVPELVTCLMEGDDPNEPKDETFPVFGVRDECMPLYYAVVQHRSLKVLELLLWYKANPFFRLPFGARTCVYGLSAFELAHAYKQYDKLELIIREYTKPQSSTLSAPQVKLTVLHSAIRETAEKHILSEFVFNDGRTIRSILKPVSELNEAELKAIYSLFEECFEVPNDKNNEELLKLFKDDFSKTSNRLIDVIYDENAVIAFNLLEIVRPKKDENKLFLHCYYGAIKQLYSRYRLMIFLAFRFGYMLQTLLPDYHVSIFYCAMDYSSYRMLGIAPQMAQIPHFPKYQTEDIRHQMKYLIAAIWKGDYFYYQELISSYIHEPLRVRSTAKKTDGTLNELIFHRDLLQSKDPKSEQPRGVPVGYMTSKESYEQFCKVARERNIDPDDHILKYTPKLLKYIKPHLSTSDKIEISLKNLTRSSFTLFNIHTAFPGSRAEIDIPVLTSAIKLLPTFDKSEK